LPESLGIVPGAYVDPTIHVLADHAVGLNEQPYSDIYYRIWVVPDTINLQNPGLGVDIPFVVWSAWNEPNQLTTVTPTGATGLTIDLSAPSDFDPVEERTVNVQITSAAPATVHATYLFTFTLGSGLFTLNATLLEWIKTIPEVPVVETWAWLTDFIVGHNGSEQRIRLRRQPRRRMEYSVMVQNDADRRTWYNRFHQYLSTHVLIPFYQYDTVVTQDAAISATKVFFDPSRTDFRDGEYSIVYRPSDGSTYVLLLDTIEVDGATLPAPLTFPVYAGDLIVPSFFGRLDNRGGIEMTSVAGRVGLGAFIIDFRSQFDRPGSTAIITTYDGLNVLERRPVVTRGPAPELMDTNPTLIDGLTGAYASKVGWLHPYVGGARQFVFARKTQPGELDYWRDFLTATGGQCIPFLTPTYRQDLVLATTPPAGALQINVVDTLYALDYFQFDTYTRFMFTNPDGSTVYRTAVDAQAQADMTTLITLDTALPVTADWATGFDISYLNRVRLDDDVVRLTHFPITTIVDLSVRTTDQ